MGQEEIDKQFEGMIEPLKGDIDPKQIAIDEAVQDIRTTELARILLENIPVGDDLMTQRLQEIATQYGLTLQEADEAVAMSAALYLENNVRVSTKIDQETEE